MTITQEKLDAFLAAVTEMYGAHMAKNYPNIAEQFRSNFIAQQGPKFTRIVRRERDEKSGSAWCFLDNETGAILKAAGWKAPAKHARGNINTPTHGLEFLDYHGPASLR